MLGEEKETIEKSDIKDAKVLKNKMGTLGFILAIISVCCGWIPVVGWILWLLGLVFSFIGVFRTPKGLAIAGLIISLFGLVQLILFALGIGLFVWLVQLL